MKKLLTGLMLALTPILAVGLAGCAENTQVKAADLMDGIRPATIHADADINGAGAAAYTDFALKLANGSLSGAAAENMLVSPLSVLSALAMTANGADGETLAQMEAVFGLSVGELNAYLRAYADALPQAEKYKLSLANSIWFTDDDSFTVNQAFLQANADWYGADIYQTPFDQSTLKDINNWVNTKTDGMIPAILGKIPEDAVMYLVNALAFDAEWQEIYQDIQVREGDFTQEDGVTQQVDFMYSEESRYLEDAQATGFLKYYQDGKYAFAALLPNEGVSVADYLSALDGDALQQMLSQPVEVKVNAALPKFQSEYSVELSDVLINMGMADAFDYTVSDFNGVGSSTEGNLVISRVLHKTFIAVDERGTKAGAATAVEMAAESAMEYEEIKTVRLDRPFVYMLIDCEAHLPVFIGTMMSVGE